MSFRWAPMSLWHTQHCLPFWHHKVNALGSPWISLSRHHLFSSRALVPFSRERYLETRCSFGCSHFWGVAASRPLADSWETYMCKLTNAYTLTYLWWFLCLPVCVVTDMPFLMDFSMAHAAPQGHAGLFLFHISNPILWQGDTSSSTIHLFQSYTHEWSQHCSPAPPGRKMTRESSVCVHWLCSQAST